MTPTQLEIQSQWIANFEKKYEKEIGVVNAHIQTALEKLERSVTIILEEIIDPKNVGLRESFECYYTIRGYRCYISCGWSLNIALLNLK